MATPQGRTVSFEGTTHHFPADATDAEIAEALGGHQPTLDAEGHDTSLLWQPSATATGDTTPYDAPNRPPAYAGLTPGNLAENFYEGAYGVGKGALEMGKDLATNPNWLSGKDSTAEKFVYQPAEQEQEIARQRWGEGRYSEATGHGLASLIPLVGPWAAERGEQLGRGDVGGTLAQLSGTDYGARAVAAPIRTPAGILKGAYEEWPTFRDAIARAKTSGDLTEVRKMATHLIVGNAFAAVAGKPGGAGPMWYEQLREDGRDVSRIEATAKSLTGIQQSALGLYTHIANVLQQHTLALTRDAMRMMRPIIDADEAAGGMPVDTSGVRARVELTKAQNGYHPTAEEQSLIDRVGGQQSDPVVDATAKRYYGKPYAQLDPIDQQNLRKLLPPDLQPSPSKTMTLQGLLQLRTDIGQAAFRNTDPTGHATMMSAYDAIGDLIKDRTAQIQGNSEPFDDYNKQLRAKFDIEQNGITADMMQNLKKPLTVKADATEGGAPKLLKKFSESPGDIDQVKNGMRKLGDKNGPRALDQAQKDAAALWAAHETVQGKNLSGITRLFLKHPTSGAAWLGIGAALGLRGLLPFPFSFLLPAALGSTELMLAERTKAGKIGLRLRSQLPPEYFEGRAEVGTPQPTPTPTVPKPPAAAAPAAPAPKTPPPAPPRAAPSAAPAPRMGAPHEAAERAANIKRVKDLRGAMERGGRGSESDWATEHLGGSRAGGRGRGSERGRP